MTQQIDVAKAIDEAKLGGFQILVIGLCFLAMGIDGFDMLILPSTAPLVLSALHIERSRFGLLVSVSLFGMLLSGLAGGVLADKVGRRGLILSGLLLFGSLTLVKAYAATYNTLLILQALTGIGIGVVFINVLALAAEYSPVRSRRFLVTCVSSAYPLGSVLSSYAAAGMGPRYGWAPIFILGGGAALVLCALCFAYLPASARQLVLQGRGLEQITRIMAKIIKMPESAVRWVTTEEKISRAPIRDVFVEGRFTITCILAVAVAATLMSGYFVVSWSPLLFNMAGMSPSRAAMVGSMFSFGAMIGSWIWGSLTDKVWPPLVLGFASLLGAVCYSLIGHVIGSLPLLITMVVVGGFGMGVQNAYNGFITSIYPTAMRGTALGLIIGFGRLASTMSPLLGGALVAAHWNTVDLYFVPAGLLGVGFVCMILANLLPSSRKSISAARDAVHPGAAAPLTTL